MILKTTPSAPPWIDYAEFLKRVLETEEFDILPFHYLEVAHVLVGW